MRALLVCLYMCLLRALRAHRLGAPLSVRRRVAEDTWPIVAPVELSQATEPLRAAGSSARRIHRHAASSRHAYPYPYPYPYPAAIDYSMGISIASRRRA